MTARPQHLVTFWEGPVPHIVAQCVRSWRRVYPDVPVIVLSDAAVLRLYPDLRATAYSTLPAYRRSDLARVLVIAEFGGLWLDASIALTAPLELPPRFAAPLMPPPDVPPRQRENYLFYAPRGDAVMAAWRREMLELLRVGDAAYCDAIQTHLELQPHLPYLAAHAALTQAQAVAGVDGAILAHRPLRHLETNGSFDWRTLAGMHALLMRTARPSAIKLRNVDRSWLQVAQAAGLYRCGATLPRALRWCEDAGSRAPG
jgi:hypothetical protein